MAWYSSATAFAAFARAVAASAVVYIMPGALCPNCIPLPGVADFVNGVRLVYPMENEAMRFMNMLGNKFFSSAFSWLLGQPVKDTLCGTKVLFRSDYELIAKNRSYFGDFDPFGDFDLLFGEAFAQAYEAQLEQLGRSAPSS